jgi:uncharacterized protein
MTTTVADSLPKAAPAAGTQVAQHSLPVSVILHLLPGFIALWVYILLIRPFERIGFPSYMAWLVANALINIPFEWGVMLYAGHKRNGRLSLEGVVLNREPMRLTTILWTTVLVFLSVLVLYLLSGPATYWTQTNLFAWLPVWFEMNDGSLGGSYPTTNLVIFNLLNIIVLIFGIAITEEFYFRGYLLPRLSRFGLWSVLINSFLFAFYHFTSLVALIQRTLFTLPLAFAAYKKRNLTPSILVHIIANIVNAVPGIQYLLSIL